MKKVTADGDARYWCPVCQKKEKECTLRYVLFVKFVDVSGEAWLTIFNEEAEKLMGCSAAELNEMRAQEDESAFNLKLQTTAWVPYCLRVTIAPHVYNNEKRQRIIVKAIAPIDCGEESKLLLEYISLLNK